MSGFDDLIKFSTAVNLVDFLPLLDLALNFTSSEQQVK